MARAQRIEYEGAVYHVTARGNERRAIFEDDADRERFVRVLGESVEQFQVRLYLYCLMTNHIHLVVETPRANLGRFMQRLQTACTVYFNLRRHRGVTPEVLCRRRRDSLDRAIAARMLCDHAGLTQRQIADMLTIGTGGAVGKQLRRLGEELSRDDRLRRQLAALADECRAKPP